MSEETEAFYIPDAEFLFVVDMENRDYRVLACHKPTAEIPAPYPWTDLQEWGANAEEFLPSAHLPKDGPGIYLWTGEIHFSDEEGDSDYRTREIRPATVADLKRFGVVFGELQP